MHKKAMELAKTLAEKLGKEDICNLTPQEYENARNISEIAKNLICAEKDYLIVEAMKESEEEEKLMGKLGFQNERMGYNNRRFVNGRYSSGRNGMKMGYNDAHYPYLYMDEDGYMDEYLNDPNFMTSENRRMGYTPSNGNHPGNSRYGYVFDEYRDRKRHYTETQNMDDKAKMKEHLNRTVDIIGDMIGEIWMDMDPVEKDQSRMKLTQKMQ